jgi:alcohol dehydrogenase, propanol-preferring
MDAMILDRAGQKLRFAADAPMPRPGAGEALIAVKACGVCRTDLHVVDGELTEPKLPLVPGHEIIGTVLETGAAVTNVKPGDRVGVPWLGHVCGRCAYCRSGRENLCDQARFTGYQIDGGYAAFATADARFCLHVPAAFGDVEAAPLMCAGLIGYRALKLAGPAERLGLWGFGAAAHIAAQVARYRGQRVYAFTKPGDSAGQEFARSLGAVWTGGSDELPPEPLDGSLIFAPVGALVPAALAATAKGGIVVCAGIHMSDIPSFPYAILWQERQIRSVANLTRADGEEFLALAPEVPVRTTTEAFPLRDANEALARLRDGRITGAAVLVP